MKTHHYSLEIVWTGNLGVGTQTYTSYSRNYTIQAKDKLKIEGSSDPSFRGDTTKYNPEELFLAAVSSCHMLWYLHICSAHGIQVQNYIDLPSATMVENEKGGHFERMTLSPTVYITNPSQIALAAELHKLAHSQCFIANSCNFPIVCEPKMYAVE